MKLQRSVIWGTYASDNLLEMGNDFDRDLYLTLIECDGGITGEFTGWSELGRSAVKPIYKMIPEDEVDDEEEDPPHPKGGCYVGSIHLPSREEMSEKKKSGRHVIPLLDHHDHRPASKLVVCIGPHDFVHLYTDQRELYKHIF